MNSVNTNRSGNILDCLLAHIIELEAEFVLYLVVNHARHHNAPGLSQRLKARRDVDPVSINIVVIDDDIADINTYAELNSFLSWQLCSALNHGVLNVDSAAYRIHDAHKFDKHTVARRLHDTSTMLCNFWIDQFLPMGFELAQRAFLVSAHQPTITSDIGR